MQEYTTPTSLVVDPSATTISTLQRYRKERPTLPLFKRRGDGGQWVTVTAGQFADEVDAVAKGLIAAGVTAGDRVALLSSTRFEWTLFDYAIWRAGATTVAIYETSSPDQVDWILTDSAASVLIVEDAGQHHDPQTLAQYIRREIGLPFATRPMAIVENPHQLDRQRLDIPRLRSGTRARHRACG